MTLLEKAREFLAACPMGIISQTIVFGGIEIEVRHDGEEIMSIRLVKPGNDLKDLFEELGLIEPLMKSLRIDAEINRY